MHCARCETDNPAGVKFCIECGAAMRNRCPSCGVENLPQAKFCGECGESLAGKAKGKGQKAKGKHIAAKPQYPTPSTQHPIAYTPRHLAERILAEREAMEARGAPDGERKSITALFADIKGSTDLIQDLDPEEARSILDPALQLMMEAVHRYEGYVAQSMGDGIFALFGAPIAHEDHPQRALYAVLLMQEEGRKQAERMRRASFSCDTTYPNESLPVIAVEFRKQTGSPGVVLAQVIPDTGADASALPWSDCEQLVLDPAEGTPGLRGGVGESAIPTVVFQAWAHVDGNEYPCRLQADFTGHERILGRDVPNRLNVLFCGPAREVIINP